MFCKRCGEMIDGVGNFCPKCGAPIEGKEKKQPQSVNDIEHGKRISLTWNRKFVAAFIGVAAIIIIIIGTITGAFDHGAAMPGMMGTEEKIEDIDFHVIGVNQQPDVLKDIIVEKYTNPFDFSYTLGEDLYIVIGYGEQPKAGYSICVNAFYETENALVISTTLIEPEMSGKSKPSYPYIVVKTKNIANKMVDCRKK